MTSNQEKIYNLLKHPMTIDKAFERSDFRNRHNFNMIVNDMIHQGILSGNQLVKKKDQILGSETIIDRMKQIGLAKTAAGTAAMFIWFFIVPTIVFIIGE